MKQIIITKDPLLADPLGAITGLPVLCSKEIDRIVEVIEVPLVTNTQRKEP